MGSMKEVIERLKDDSEYYGEYGSRYLSNSNIETLFTDPMSLGLKKPDRKELLMGSYFHIALLENDKLSNFKIVEASTRNSKDYKDAANGGVLLLQKEVDILEPLIKRFLNNDYCAEILMSDIDVEQPAVKEIGGNLWKGKADILNHDTKKIVDIKTTSDLAKFKNSAYKYNYDSQAYLYREFFGYEMEFLVMDKLTGHIGKFDCSDSFYESGRYKVEKANQIYDNFFKSGEVDRSQFVLEVTL